MRTLLLVVSLAVAGCTASVPMLATCEPATGTTCPGDLVPSCGDIEVSATVGGSCSVDAHVPNTCIPCDDGGPVVCVPRPALVDGLSGPEIRACRDLALACHELTGDTTGTARCEAQIDSDTGELVDVRVSP